MKLKLGILLLFVITISFSQESTLINFELQDQFEKIYTNNDYRGSIFIVIGSNSSGRKYNPIWSAAIHNELKDEPVFEKIKMNGIANLSAVPFFLKGFIRNKFPKDPEKWILMDWKGKFSKAYHMKPGVSNILIFNVGGQLVFQTTATDLDAELLAVLVEKIKELDR